MLTHADRIASLRSAVEDDRVIHSAWTREEEGRHLVCLLAAYSPEAGEAETATACPADVIPAWLAHLLVRIDDNTPSTPEYRQPMLRRWPGALAPADQWSPETWGRILRRHLIRCIDMAVARVTIDRWRVRAACAEVRRLLVEGGSQEEWRTAARDAAAAEAAAYHATYYDAVAHADAANAAEAAAAVAHAAVADAPATEAAFDADYPDWARLTDALLDDLEAAGRGEALAVA